MWDKKTLNKNKRERGERITIEREGGSGELRSQEKRRWFCNGYLW
jgi:hypothetical protein